MTVQLTHESKEECLNMHNCREAVAASLTEDSMEQLMLPSCKGAQLCFIAVMMSTPSIKLIVVFVDLPPKQ